jgi:hypothetical protein
VTPPSSFPELVHTTSAFGRVLRYSTTASTAATNSLIKAPGVRLELTTNGLTVPTRPSVWSRYVRSSAVPYGSPDLPVRPVRPRAVWYGYTNGYTTNPGYGSATADRPRRDANLRRNRRRIDQPPRFVHVQPLDLAGAGRAFGGFLSEHYGGGSYKESLDGSPHYRIVADKIFAKDMSRHLQPD